MEIIHIQHPHTKAFSAVSEPCVMALGFFDGVHLGHQMLIARASMIAKEQNLKLSVMTFFPHPKHIVNDDPTRLKYITPLSRKACKLQELGVDQLIVIKFDSAFASLPSSQFCKQYLQDFQCKHAVAGFDFHYGFKGQGDINTLKRDGKGIFEVTEINKFEIGQEKVSSTLIRTLVSQGRMAEIPTYLGTWYESEGTVLQSIQPHLPVSLLYVAISEEFLLIPNGIYEIEVIIDGQSWSGVSKRIVKHSNKDYLFIELEDSISVPKGKEICIKWKKKIDRSSKQTIFLSKQYQEHMESVI